MPGNSVLVVGSFNVDHAWVATTLPRPGETLVGEYRSGPGGKGFNQAVAAARSGAPTNFVCALGDDAGGALARSLAAADGIGLCAQPSDAPTGTAGIFVGGDGANSIVIGPGANAALTPAFVEQQRALITGSRVVLAQLESPTGSVAQALRVARETGALAVLNPAPANVAITAELLALADIITPNETEFAARLSALAGLDVDAESIAQLDDATLHGLCRALLPHGTVVVTLGASGCFVSHAPGVGRGDPVPAYRIAAEPVRAVDTTGAGDAFNGALAASIAHAPQQPFATHVKFANRYAARSTEVAGAASAMPSLADVVERFGA